MRRSPGFSCLLFRCVQSPGSCTQLRGPNPTRRLRAFAVVLGGGTLHRFQGQKASIIISQSRVGTPVASVARVHLHNEAHFGFGCRTSGRRAVHEPMRRFGHVAQARRPDERLQSRGVAIIVIRDAFSMAVAGKCCSRRLLGQQVAKALRRQGRRRREDARVVSVRLRLQGRLRPVNGDFGGL